jgi:predicted TIM-barrel fold metal-dependent hydrolase
MADLDFAIVDAHIHQWDPRTTPRRASPLARLLGWWPALYLGVGRRVFPRPIREFVGVPDNALLPYQPVDHARDSAGFTVDTVVHVEAGWMESGPLGPVGETRWVDALDFGVGKRLGAIVAHASLRAPNVDELLAAHLAASPKVRGIRQMAAWHPDPGVFAWARKPHLYRDPDFLRGFERLVARGLRFDAWVYSHQLPEVTELAARFPEAAIVLDHLGTPVAAAAPYAATGATTDERARIEATWREDLARLAEHKNVFAKLSGLTMPVVGFGFHRRAEPPAVAELVERVGPFIRHGLDVFGVERCFFASNFPMDKAGAPFARLFAAYAELARELGPGAPRALLRDNALRFYAV